MAFFGGKVDEKSQTSGKSEETNPAVDPADVSATEEAQLKTEINRMETELFARYAVVGREYYATNGGKPLSDNMADSFREIRNLNRKIQDDRNQIRLIRGITTCKKCGADILITDTFCGNCGARIISEVTISAEGGNCPNCGRPIPAGKTFCTTCGAKVTVSPTASEPDSDSLMEEEKYAEAEFSPENGTTAGAARKDEASSEAKQSNQGAGKSSKSQIFTNIGKGKTAASAQEESLVCPYCGAALEPDDVFCLKCGKKVVG